MRPARFGPAGGRRLGRLLVVAAVILGSVPAWSADCDRPVADASRIAVAGGSITEILYALGEQQRIVAVDATSNYPEDAARFPSVGYVRNLSAEGLLSMAPTLILGEHDMGPDVVLEQIAGVGVNVVRVPEEFSAAGIARKVMCVGTVIGRRAAAQRYVDTELQPVIDRLADLRPQGDAPRVAVLLSISEGAPLAAGVATSGNGLLRMAGAVNVFEGFDGWKPVSLEHMTVAAPDLILVPDRGAAAAGGVTSLLDEPGIRMTPAGRARRVAVLDGMAMLGFGPRTLTSALELAERLHQP
ncbi:MAG: ABC transporter substrate-binding protein [Gammaproteobacteria bacterium]|nr:ABC transporter substrate-binding protein [Gammaproteobacteria bacterium]